ncbi:MAG: AraC family transcriptional regulator [Myxococcota bacterium]
MKSETRQSYEEAVRGTVARIARSLDDALDLRALAKAAALSPFHFHRIFRGMVGETPLELHRRLRLERAAHALAVGEHPVTRIALGAGYETHESFTRAFRRRFGRTPSVFRERARGIDAEECLLVARLPSRSGIHFRPDGAIAGLRFPREGESMHVDIETLDTMRVAAVRHVGPYHRIAEAFAALHGHAGPAGLYGPESAMVALYYDDPEATPATELRSDAGLVVRADAALPEGLREVHIPAGRYALGLHVGPYAGLGDAWETLMGQWLPASGERLAVTATTFERYLNDPSQTPEAELRTQLCLGLD